MQIGVVGASGYLGAELLRLLAGHPALKVAVVQADSSAGARVSDLYPNLAPFYGELVFSPLDAGGLGGLDAVFIALPSGRSQDFVPTLAGTIPLVVDLGGDFRLKDASLYPIWYGFEHRVPELLGRFVYGLPELFRPELVGASLIAAPGCYVTAAALALAPLVKEGVIESTGIVVDAASGSSGAGRSPSASFHHPVVNESFSAYGLINHRHTPEMEQAIGAQILFTPHLAPMTRGILATCYGRAVDSDAGSRALDVLESAYRDEPFVQVSAAARSTRDTYGCNTVQVTARYDARTGYVVSLAALDNLVKGGAGQAIQAANLALGLEETLGLPTVGLVP
jgi:N-acetyl-gamma-glutamyl-phosphate reductase